MVFFFNTVTGAVSVNPSIMPQVLITRTTRSNSSLDVTYYVPRKCNTSTFQRSFLSRTIRTWNCLAKDLKLSLNLTMNQFKSVLHKYYLESLSSQFDLEVPHSWKTICPFCNSARKLTPYATCCF